MKSLFFRCVRSEDAAAVTEKEEGGRTTIKCEWHAERKKIPPRKTKSMPFHEKIPRGKLKEKKIPQSNGMV